MKAPVYKSKPIGSVKSLARALGIPAGELLKLSEEVNRYYRANKPYVKSDGSLRQHYTVVQPLNSIHRRIKDEIFYKVVYPPYLCAVKDCETPRSHIYNAKLHAGRRIVICEDIVDFFTSIKAPIVLKLWQHFFHFPKDVAHRLTQLTTYSGFLPQGAATSSYVASLIFWDKEPQLEDELRQRGLSYSRYVDDIVISSDKQISKDELQFVTEKVYGMLLSVGLRPNRMKRDVQTRSRQMTVHNLNVNKDRPSMPKEERSKIRAAVRDCERMARTDRASVEYKKLYDSTSGRVGYMQSLHSNEAQKLRKRLRAIRPIIET